jgi:hypothetical protein
MDRITAVGGEVVMVSGIVPEETTLVVDVAEVKHESDSSFSTINFFFF